MNRNIMNLVKGILVLTCIFTSITTSQGEEQSITVTYIGESTYSVEIPATTSLKDENGVQVGTYKISVTGDFLNNEKLVVQPDETIIMIETTNSGKQDITATIVQEKTEWLSSDLTTTPQTTGTITTSSNLGAGVWSGTVNFNISLEEIVAPEKSKVLMIGNDFRKIVPSAATSIVFTDEIAPSEFDKISLSEDGSNGVVGWLEGTVFKVSTQLEETKVVFNEDCKFMFSDLTNITSYDFSNVDTSNVTNMSSMFAYSSIYSGITSLDLRTFDTSNVTDMSAMFSRNRGIENLDVSSFNTQKVTNMHSMFYDLWKLTTLDVSNFDTSNVTNMQSMFYNLGVTTLDVSNFDTINVKNMHGMFSSCKELTNLDVSNFNTMNVTEMSSMFQGLYDAHTIKLGVNFKTSNIESMANLFAGCSNLVTLDLSGFDTSNVEDMRWMFEYCTKLTTINVGDLWNVNKVSSSSSMFDSCTSLVGQSGTMYDEKKVDKTMANYQTGYLTYKSKS